MSFDGLAAAGKQEVDESMARLVQDLDAIGVKVERNKPRAPLELLADEGKRNEFLKLMGWVLETRTG